VKPLKYVILCLVIICASGVISYYRLKGEYFTREITSLNRKKYPDLVVGNCDKVISVFYKIDPVGVPIDWYAAMALFSAGKTDASELRMKSALE
jgi:hypothetical protein